MLEYDLWSYRLQESRQHVRGILEAVASSAYYPESSSAPALDLLDRSAHALAAAEAEHSAAERRQELFVLFRNSAKIFPEEAYAVVGPRLQALVSEANTDFQVGLQSSLESTIVLHCRTDCLMVVWLELPGY